MCCRILVSFFFPSFFSFFSGVTGPAAGRGQPPPPTGINIAIDGYKSCDYRRAAPSGQTDCIIRLVRTEETALEQLRLPSRTKQLVANTNDKRETTSVYTAALHRNVHSSLLFTVEVYKILCYVFCVQVVQVQCATRCLSYNNVKTIFSPVSCRHFLFCPSAHDSNTRYMYTGCGVEGPCFFFFFESVSRSKSMGGWAVGSALALVEGMCNRPLSVTESADITSQL